MGSCLVGEGFIAAFGSGDRARLGEFYSEGAVLWTPLTGPLRGRDAIAQYFGDQAPEICSAAPGDLAAADAGAPLARRFTDAFGRRDAGALNEIYAEDVALYTPLPGRSGDVTR